MFARLYICTSIDDDFFYCKITKTHNLYVIIRQDLQTARDKLQKMLIEMLRITVATEEHVNRKLGVCVSHGHSGDETPNSRTAKTSSNPHESGALLIPTFQF